MEHECTQKDEIANIQKKLDSRDELLADIRVKQAEIGGDVTHIKRLDNGMSHSIANMNTLLTKLEPVIGHHADIIKRIEGIGWTLSTALILTLVGLIGWAITKGFKLNI